MFTTEAAKRQQGSSRNKVYYYQDSVVKPNICEGQSSDDLKNSIILVTKRFHQRKDLKMIGAFGGKV